MVRACLGSVCFLAMFFCTFKGQVGNEMSAEMLLLWSRGVQQFFLSLFCTRWSCLFDKRAIQCLGWTRPRIAQSSTERWKRKREIVLVEQGMKH